MMEISILFKCSYMKIYFYTVKQYRPLCVHKSLTKGDVVSFYTVYGCFL